MICCFLEINYAKITNSSQLLLPPQQFMQKFQAQLKQANQYSSTFLSKSPSTVFLLLPVLLCSTVGAHQHTLLEFHIIRLPSYTPVISADQDWCNIIISKSLYYPLPSTRHMYALRTYFYSLLCRLIMDHSTEEMSGYM